MNFKQLEYLVTLAETLSFTRASALCHISPSALTRHIQTLEEETGSQLFVRDNRTVSITREGKRLVQFANDTLSAWQQTQADLQLEQQELRGALSVYCSVTASYSFLHDLLDRFRSAHPSVELRLHTGDPEHAVERVREGMDDIGMAASPEHLTAGLLFQPVGRTPLLFVGPKADPDLCKLFDQGRPETLAEVPLILPETGVARDLVNRWIKEKQFQPTLYAQVTGNEAIVSMVSLGFGVGVVPQIVLENSPLADRVEVLGRANVLENYEVGLFIKQKRLKEPLLAAFWSLLDQTPGL